MCHLIETICIESGQARLLPYHAARMQQSRQALFGLRNPIDLQNALAPRLGDCQQGLYKCRIVYREQIEEVTFSPYQRPQVRSLKKVYSNSIEYFHKYADRDALHQLYLQRETYNDVLIIKNGWVTDMYIGNLLFFDGQQWFTPDTPLLRGVQRQYLLDEKLISAAKIRESDLENFHSFKFINAMNPFEASAGVDIRHIH